MRDSIHFRLMFVFTLSVRCDCETIPADSEGQMTSSGHAATTTDGTMLPTTMAPDTGPSSGEGVGTLDDPTDDTSSTGSSSTDVSAPCDEDPACGPGESLATCPDQCGACGDGVTTGTEECDHGAQNLAYSLTEPAPGSCSTACTLMVPWCGDGAHNGDEACDNGPGNQTYWMGPPAVDACSETCTKAFEWCGDENINGDEECDNGDGNVPAVYSKTKVSGTCTLGCKWVGYCGDGVVNGLEACDTIVQTATCEADCRSPACGDGTLNHAAGEVCDDKNMVAGDGCGDCNLEYMVFISSANFAGDLGGAVDNPNALTGVALADHRCQQLAEIAGLKGTYKAWLSTNDEHPDNRFSKITGYYRLPTPGFPIVAKGWKGLTSGKLEHPINVNEFGIPTGKYAFTNTRTDGQNASASHCGGWTKADSSKTTIGNSSATNGTWTNLAITQSCSTLSGIYCFQDI